MSPKSITVAADAGAVLELLDTYAGEHGSRVERRVIQNATRVLISGQISARLNVYPSKGGGCKVVFDDETAPTSDAIAELLGGRSSSKASTRSAGAAIEPVLPDAPAWIGSDESGKGDYFGPLVVAAVALTAENWRVLVELGVRDSKSLSDTRAIGIAGELGQAFPNKIVVVLPPRYNELWAEFGNLNRLLAWAHARAIEDLLEQAPQATAAVADQFGDESLIRDALFRRGREIKLVQMPRAERDPAVAAASILARAEFLRRLELLGAEAGVSLPKGASPGVEAVARAIVAQQGRAALARFAKTHFKTTKRV